MDSGTALTISFIVYTLLIIAVGLYSSRWRKKTSEDFVLANRELGPWASSLSASASAESGWVMLGLVGEAFKDGLSTFWIVPGIAAGYLFNWYVIAERLRKSTAQSGAVTLTQYISHRYGANSTALRVIPVLIITVAMLGYVAAQMNAAGKAFEATFHLDYEWGVIAGAVIILTYTLTGGFRAICWTDIIQALFMVAALIIMPIVILFNVNGFGNAMSVLQAADPNLLSFTADKVGFGALGFVIGLLGIGLGYPGQPHVLARFMAAKDTATVKKAGMIALTWMVLVYIGAIFMGMFARAYFGTLADAEQALPLAVGEFLPPIIGGFVIAAIISAICSTADSQLIVVSSTLSRDVLPMLRKKAGEMKFEMVQRIDRIVLLALAMLSVLFALSENRVIFDFVLYAWSGLGASFGPVVILGLMWKRTNRQGAIAGMLTGALVTYAWRETAALKAIVYELVPAFILAFLVTWLVSLATSSDRDNANH